MINNFRTEGYLRESTKWQRVQYPTQAQQEGFSELCQFYCAPAVGAQAYSGGRILSFQAFIHVVADNALCRKLESCLEHCGAQRRRSARTLTWGGGHVRVARIRRHSTTDESVFPRKVPKSDDLSLVVAKVETSQRTKVTFDSAHKTNKLFFRDMVIFFL